jgi:hypothetical protein
MMKPGACDARAVRLRACWDSMVALFVHDVVIGDVLLLPEPQAAISNTRAEPKRYLRNAIPLGATYHKGQLHLILVACRPGRAYLRTRRAAKCAVAHKARYSPSEPRLATSSEHVHDRFIVGVTLRRGL